MAVRVRVPRVRLKALGRNEVVWVRCGGFWALPSLLSERGPGSTCHRQHVTGGMRVMIPRAGGKKPG
jgi:hypothetical protein